MAPLLSPSPTDGQAEAGCVRDAAMHEGGVLGRGRGWGGPPCSRHGIQAEVVGGFLSLQNAYPRAERSHVLVKQWPCLFLQKIHNSGDPFS